MVDGLWNISERKPDSSSVDRLDSCCRASSCFAVRQAARKEIDCRNIIVSIHQFQDVTHVDASIRRRYSYKCKHKATRRPVSVTHVSSSARFNVFASRIQQQSTSAQLPHPTFLQTPPNQTLTPIHFLPLIPNLSIISSCTLTSSTPPSNSNPALLASTTVSAIVCA